MFSAVHTYKLKGGGNQWRRKQYESGGAHDCRKLSIKRIIGGFGSFVSDYRQFTLTNCKQGEMFYADRNGGKRL